MFPSSPAPSLTYLLQNRHDHQGSDVHNIDQRVNGRTDGILVGITNSITRHHGFMYIGTLTTDFNGHANAGYRRT